MASNGRKLAAEFIGTFTLVFAGTATAVLQGIHSGHGTTGALSISFAFGFTLMVLVYAIGGVSGCHVNPAVSIAAAVAGRMPKPLLPGYIVAQCLGAIAASGALFALIQGEPAYIPDVHGLGANGNPMQLSMAALIGWEALLTAIFLFVILCATRPDAVPAGAGLAIGGFLFIAHLIGAPLGDSSLNPARSLGPALFAGTEALAILPIYIIGPILGGLIGVGLYRAVHSD